MDVSSGRTLASWPARADVTSRTEAAMLSYRIQCAPDRRQGAGRCYHDHEPHSAAARPGATGHRAVGEPGARPADWRNTDRAAVVVVHERRAAELGIAELGIAEPLAAELGIAEPLADGVTGVAITAAGSAWASGPG
jgi:hypothetical protein